MDKEQALKEIKGVFVALVQTVDTLERQLKDLSKRIDVLEDNK